MRCQFLSSVFVSVCGFVCLSVAMCGYKYLCVFLCLVFALVHVHIPGVGHLPISYPSSWSAMQGIVECYATLPGLNVVCVYGRHCRTWRYRDASSP